MKVHPPAPIFIPPARNLLPMNGRSPAACLAMSTGGDAKQCLGDYLLLGKVRQVQQQVVVNVPPPAAWISVIGCTPVPPSNLCDGIPSLLISGEETMPGQTISSIQGIIDNQPFKCNSDACPVLLFTTGGQTIQVEFWANSSLGDFKPTFYGAGTRYAG